jgi:hypothetical protein
VLITQTLSTWLAAVAASPTKTFTNSRFAQTTHFAISANQPDTLKALSGKVLYFDFVNNYNLA